MDICLISVVVSVCRYVQIYTTFYFVQSKPSDSYRHTLHSLENNTQHLGERSLCCCLVDNILAGEIDTVASPNSLMGWKSERTKVIYSTTCMLVYKFENVQSCFTCASIFFTALSAKVRRMN